MRVTTKPIKNDSHFPLKQRIKEMANTTAKWTVVMLMLDTVLSNRNTGELMTLTLSLLGLGGLRSFEKSKGIARDKMK
jgi:hypothetical protein